LNPPNSPQLTCIAALYAAPESQAMMKKLVLLWTALRGDARLLWRALRHPMRPSWLLWGCLGLLAYLVMPIDILPDFIPGLGVVDDILVITFGIKFLLKRLPQTLKRELGI
jgi:uncharacterized membrane protein YkvA (DUF1232 family)